MNNLNKPLPIVPQSATDSLDCVYFSCSITAFIPCNWHNSQHEFVHNIWTLLCSALLLSSSILAVWLPSFMTETKQCRAKKSVYQCSSVIASINKGCHIMYESTISRGRDTYQYVTHTHNTWRYLWYLVLIASFATTITSFRSEFSHNYVCAHGIFSNLAIKHFSSETVIIIIVIGVEDRQGVRP